MNNGGQLFLFLEGYMQRLGRRRLVGSRFDRSDSLDQSQGIASEDGAAHFQFAAERSGLALGAIPLIGLLALARL